MMTSQSTMHSQATARLRSQQGGAFLLEALVGLLIFAFGILGIVALQAQSIRFTNDAEVRAEVTYQVNSLISTMWTKYNPQNAGALQSEYDSTVGGPGFTQFVSDLTAALPPGVTLPVPPVVTVDGAAPVIAKQSTASSVVYVRVAWQMPGDSTQHNYAATGVIGLNPL
jgi:type IV pilus assembly protein PilV